jgi:hypothetical protein
MSKIYLVKGKARRLRIVPIIGIGITRQPIAASKNSRVEGFITSIYLPFLLFEISEFNKF